MPRPKSPLISREAAVAATLRIIDRDGLAGFSLERLARELGVRGPSLYHHFSGRAELLSEAARELLAGVEVPPDPGPGRWDDWLVEVSLRAYRQVMQHPRAAGLLFAHFPTGVLLVTNERAARILAERGVPAGERWTVMRGLEKLVYGLAMADADDVINGRPALPAGVDPDRWPHLSAALAAGPVERERLVERAARFYLTGVAALTPAAGGSYREDET